MRSSRAGPDLALLLAAGALAACAARGPAPAELDPLETATPAPAPLPDEAERTAARLAAFALAGRDAEAALALEALRARDVALLAAGERPDGLADNAADLLAAGRGWRAYREHAERALDDGRIDAALRRRLEAHLESHPLRVAERRLGESRRLRAGEIFNRVTVPVSRLALGGALHPVEAGRAALAALLAMRSFPPITTQERQALRAYRELLEREPDAPEREWVLEQVERYSSKLTRARREEALALGARSLELGRPDVALAHLERAARIGPVDDELSELRATAARALEARAARAGATFRLRSAALPLGARRREELGELARAVAVAPLDTVSRRARAIRAAADWRDLDDELAFLAALSGDRDRLLRALEPVAALEPGPSNMARHARWILADPEQNPYAQYAAARDEARRGRLAWLALGRRAGGPIDRELPRPVEWLLDVPGFASSLLTFPLRGIRYPGTRATFGAEVIHAGERYLAQLPDGAHADEVRRELESLYAARGDWSHALAHHRERPDASQETLLRYRERIAERTLAAATLQRRVDVRAALYQSIDAEYPETPQAAQARDALRALLETATPQEIRVSREFLEQHPTLLAPGALALRPELLDGEPENGELAPEGVTLIGQTLVRIALAEREPVVAELAPGAFARFVALLEEAHYTDLVADARERPVADPQRDWFFERARLGLLDAPDLRPAATSRAAFLGPGEKYGPVGARDSILPVEIVLQGGLEDFGVATFPRIRTPSETPDAFLFR